MLLGFVQKVRFQSLKLFREGGSSMTYAATFHDLKDDRKTSAFLVPFLTALFEARVRKAAHQLAQRQDMIASVKTYQRAAEKTQDKTRY
jgi:predicted type IV restriction endonuclease